MTTILCQHCEAKNEAGTELCVACGQPLLQAGAGERDQAGPEQPEQEEDVQRWLRELPEFGKLDAESLANDDESLPAWLQAVRAHANELSDREADELMEFLTELEPGDSAQSAEQPAEDTAVKAKMTAELPAWVAALTPEEQWPRTEAEDEMAQHFAEVEETDEERLPSTAQLPQTAPLEASVELDGIPDLLAGEELPDWLANQAAIDQQRPASEEPPNWPSRSTRLRKAQPGAPAPQPALPAAESDPEPESSDTLAGELAAAIVAGEMAKQGLDETPSSPDPGGWMDDPQNAELEQTLQAMLELPDADTSEGRVDQWLDILDGSPSTSDSDQIEQLVMDSDLETADVPDWMQALQPGQIADEPEASDLGPPEEDGPLAGLRGIVPAAGISLTGPVDRSAMKMQMSKEQRQQAALLRRLTAMEPEQEAAAASPGVDSFLLVRVVLGLALLLIVLLGFLLPDVTDLLPWFSEPAMPPAAEQAREAIEMNGNQAALVAFDYTPSMAGELDGVAQALLADLAAHGAPVLTVSQIAAGVPMAKLAAESVEGLQSRALGYLPGEAAGLRALGDCLDLGCQSLAGQQLSAETQAAMADVNLVVVLTADRDSLVGWIEQVGTQSEAVMMGGVTQALAPVARPYLISDQLAGLLEGMPAGVAYTMQTSSGDAAATEQLASLTLAQWLVIGALLAGALYFGIVEPAASAVSQGAKR